MDLLFWILMWVIGCTIGFLLILLVYALVDDYRSAMKQDEEQQHEMDFPARKR